MSEKMKNLAVRTLSGIVLAAIMLGAVCWSQWSFGALLLVILLCGMHEFYTLAAARGAQPQRLIGMLTVSSSSLRISPWSPRPFSTSSPPT